jgi:Na+/H+ antiporter NhaD/arsenite permease-like protein
MIVLGVLSQEEAFLAIDLNVILLLVGMMLIAKTMFRTGVFGWVALKSAKVVHGEPAPVLVILSLFTAIASAFLPNVTTVLLIAPVSILIAEHLLIGCRPLLISLVLSSNIGGVATLVGDPPNLLIGSADLASMPF